MLCMQSDGGMEEEREAMAEQLEGLQQTIAERDSELLALNQELSDLADRLPVRPSAVTSPTLAFLLCVSASGTVGRWQAGQGGAMKLPDSFLACEERGTNTETFLRCKLLTVGCRRRAAGCCRGRFRSRRSRWYRCASGWTRPRGSCRTRRRR